MQYPTCHHLKEDGIYCASPALRGRDYCYYHLNLRRRRLARAQALRRGQPYRLHLPTLDNLRAVQVALTEVLEAIAERQLEPKSAGLMLYGLQQATTMIRMAELNDDWQDDDDYEDQPGRAREFPDFEQKFGVPPGIDLEAEPEVALQQAEEHPVPAPAQARVAHSETSAPPAPAPSAQSRQRGERGPSYQDLRQQLRAMQEAPASPAADKKPTSSLASPAPEVADTA